VGDVEHVAVLLHLFIELLHACQLVQRHCSACVPVRECLAEVVVAVVEGVAGEEVGDGDGGVGLGAGQLQHDVVGDAGGRSNNEQTHSINIWYDGWQPSIKSFG
jgi:hypothetical protein